MSHATLLDVVSGERHVHVVEQDDSHMAFLAERPVRKGHIVVVTRAVVDAVADLDDKAHAALWHFVHRIERRMRERLPCARVCVQVIGWAVRHAHVHLIPTDAPGQVAGLDGEPLPVAVMESLARSLQAEDTQTEDQ
ncbi:MAG: histidine triad (HIT) family protein [Planctomycetota bacterium]